VELRELWERIANEKLAEYGLTGKPSKPSYGKPNFNKKPLPGSKPKPKNGRTGSFIRSKPGKIGETSNKVRCSVK
jgi:hypothetical protein